MSPFQGSLYVAALPSLMKFRPYTPADRSACLRLFDTLVPEYFAPNERVDYERFLAGVPQAYHLCIRNDAVLAAFGFVINDTRGRIQWIMAANEARGTGMGGSMMRHVLEAARDAGVHCIDIAASQKSASFFAHYGAKQQKVTKEGWGPGLDRIDMELVVDNF